MLVTCGIASCGPFKARPWCEPARFPHVTVFSGHALLSGILPAGMETGFLELSSLLTVAASLDDEIREVCRARDSERFLKLVADYQSRIYALHHGEFLIFGGGTRVAWQEYFSRDWLSCGLLPV